MSKPRYDWWGYVKGMIRRYPQLKAEYEELHRQAMRVDYSGMPHAGGAHRATEELALRALPASKQRELDAVRQAVEGTAVQSTGAERLKLIRLVFWEQSCNLMAAATEIGLSYRTATRYHGDFIRMVAANRGLLDPPEKMALKGQNDALY